MITVPEMIPQNDNVPTSKVCISWPECFLVVACVTIAIITVYQGITSLAMVLAGL